MGPGPAWLGGAAGDRAVETGPHPEGRPHQGNAAPDSGPQQQDPDGPVPQGPASSAGDGGHL